MATAVEDQILHHCAHRLHGIDPVRILDVTGAVTQRGRGAVPRQDGHRARARDHDQGAERSEYQGRTASSSAQPHRHPRVDFNYEVSRSLSACEGAVLVVDSTQSVEARRWPMSTAIEQGLEVLPCSTRLTFRRRTSTAPKQIEDVIGLDCSGLSPAAARPVSASPTSSSRSCEGPPAGGSRRAPARAHLRLLVRQLPRAMIMVRVVDTLRRSERDCFMATKRDYEVTGSAPSSLSPSRSTTWARRGRLPHGSTSRRPRHQVGDTTVTHAGKPAMSPSPASGREADGLRPGIFPTDSADYPDPRRAEKLHMNDAAFSFEPDSSESARVRLPLRVPGPPPHGDHPGGSARVQPRPHHHRAERRLPYCLVSGEMVSREPGKAPPHRTSTGSGADREDESTCRRTSAC